MKSETFWVMIRKGFELLSLYKGKPLASFEQKSDIIFFQFRRISLVAMENRESRAEAGQSLGDYLNSQNEIS